MSDPLDKRLSADLYEGAYGLTLRLGVPSDDHLIALKKALHAMADGNAARIMLEKEGGFFLTGASSVLLLLSRDAENKKTVFVEGRSASRRVQWRATRAQWRICVDLLEGFTAGKPAHQYLSKEGVDDALVEVAYLEG